MAKWEMIPSEWTAGGLKPGNPYRKGNEYGKPGAEYPKMLYQAKQLPNGKWATAMIPPPFIGFRDQNEWDRAVQAALLFTSSCYRIVDNEAQHARARDEGWRDGPDEAMQFRDALEKAVGEAAAERNYRDKNMSPAAKAEVAQAESEHFGHLADIPVKRGPGRPRKNPEAS